MGIPSPRVDKFIFATKLALCILYRASESSTTPVWVAVIDQVTESNQFPKRKIHSLNQHNQGVVPLPHDYSFTLRLYENHEAIDAMLWLGFNNRPFDLVIAPDPNVHPDYSPLNSEWKPIQELYNKCFVIGRTNSIVIDNVPVSTFNCIALECKIGAITGIFGDGSWLEDGPNGTAAVFGGNQILP